MTERRPTISVVTPSFNQVQFLDEAMQSVLGQTYPHVEYVVIDGGSSDGSAALIQIAAVPVAIASPRVGVAVALLCVAFFLLPQPKPRYRPGEEPSSHEKLSD